MKPILSLGFFACLMFSKAALAGCGGVTFTTTNGISASSSGGSNTVTISSADSVAGSLELIGSCYISSVLLTFEGDTIYSGSPTYPAKNYPLTFSQKAGSYHMVVWVGSAYPRHLSFTIQGTPVGLSELIGNLDKQVTVYPNPAHDEVSISSQEEIKGISVHDLSGKLIFTQVVNDQKVTLPLSGYTAGIYFVSVIMPSNRSVTRKVCVR